MGKENTKEFKNRCIVEMMGWEYDELSESFDTPFLELVEPQAFGDEQFSSKLRDFELKFHSDANWQFEALDYMKQLGYRFMMADNLIVIQCPVVKKLSKIAVKLECSGLSRKEAIFEALFQFSQYLKEKK